MLRRLSDLILGWDCSRPSGTGTWSVHVGTDRDHEGLCRAYAVIRVQSGGEATYREALFGLALSPDLPKDVAEVILDALKGQDEKR